MNDSPTSTRPLSPCGQFDTRLQRILDGETSVDALTTDPHLPTCSACADSALAARLLLTTLAAPAMVPVPAGFASRVLDRLQSERVNRQQRLRTIRIAIVSLAAAVLLAVGASSPWSTGPTPISVAVASRLAPAESLTRVDESLAPAQQLFASVSTAPAPMATPHTPIVGTSTLPTTAFAPVTNTTKRAIDLFVRDLSGLARVNKSKF
jgi:hypothetical protein